MGKQKHNQILVGFAAETDNLVENAVKKLAEKKLDLIVVNDVSRPDIGFGSDNNAITIINPQGQKENISPRSKLEIAELLLNYIVTLYKNKLSPTV